MHSTPTGATLWQGCQYIGNRTLDEKAAPYFRKRFTLPDKPHSASVSLCGVGYHELYVNGQKASENLLVPAQSIYDKTVYYETIDISALLHEGDNSLCVLLGNGLYNCFDGMAWMYDTCPWRDRPKLLLYAEILLENREKIELRSGPDFETGASQITYNMFYGGETQDLTLEDPLVPGAPGESASIVAGPGGVLKAMQAPFVRELKRISPISKTELSDGRVVYDFGQNMAGWVRVNASASARTTFRLLYSEEIDEKGELDRTRIAVFQKLGRFQQDEYTIDAAHPARDARPHFCYHGFRYVEVSVTEGALRDIELSAVVLNSALDRLLDFRCSNEIVEKIMDMTDKATLSNLVNVPTDCPQREKNGWTGDAALSAEQMCLSYDMRAFFRRWLSDIRDAQRPSGQIPGIVPSEIFGYNWGNGPAWDAVLFELPRAVFAYYGDDSLLRENYDAMKRYMGFCESMADAYTVDFGLGDWCPPVGGAAAYVCPTRMTDTGHFYHFAKIVRDAAERFGYQADALYYAALAEKIQCAFLERYFDARSGEIRGGNQTGHGCAIYYGFVEGDNAQKVADRLAEIIRANGGALDFGILGHKYVPEALSRHGYTQLAYDMLTREGFPSYRNWIDMGATTLLETWNGDSSHNHHMFSDVRRWFVESIAGLRAPCYARKLVRFTPDFPEGIDSASARFDSPAGRVACSWKRECDGIRFEAAVPEGFVADITAPKGYALTREGTAYRFTR